MVATRGLGWALALSTPFFTAHAQTLRRIVAESGQVSLLITAPAGEVNGFSLTPAESRLFSQLGLTVEFVFSSAGGLPAPQPGGDSVLSEDRPHALSVPVRLADLHFAPFPVR